MCQASQDVVVQNPPKVYTVEQLREIIVPIARRWDMRSASLFGSYARGEADEDSDIDLILDYGDQRITSIFGVGGEVERITGKPVDTYAWTELQPGSFRDAVMQDAVKLWET